MSHMSPSTVIVLGNHSGEKIISCSIASLYPMPYLYRMTRRPGIDKKIVETVSIKEGKMESNNEFLENNGVKELYDYVVQYKSESCKADIDKDRENLHPVMFFAGVQFNQSHRKKKAATFIQCAEYGCSLDPISQLVPDMLTEKQTNSDDTNNGELLVMIDQANIPHAPFAAARSILSENGFKDTKVLVMNQDGIFSLISVEVSNNIPSVNIETTLFTF